MELQTWAAAVVADKVQAAAVALVGLVLSLLVLQLQKHLHQLLDRQPSQLLVETLFINGLVQVHLLRNKVKDGTFCKT
jgi:hypothetical protein